MFGYFRVTLIINFVYMYSARRNFALLTILDVEHNILRLPTFHCKSQRGCGLPKYILKNYFKKITPHRAYGPILNN